MASITLFFQRLKPALDRFLKESTRENLSSLEKELYAFNWIESKLVNVHILLPLILKLDELNGKNQELRTSLINTLSFVLSNVYLSEVKSLSIILTIVLKQVRNFEKATKLENLSEEIKLATVLCIAEAFKRSTTDVLEKFYNKGSATLLGHILLMLVELIDSEQYRKLRIAAIECLAVVFYVHDQADTKDVVLRNQVADTLFIYLPKVIGVLFKTSLADDKIGETLKAESVKVFGSILHIIYEDTNDIEQKLDYSRKDFQKLIKLNTTESNENDFGGKVLLEGSNFNKEKLEEQLTRLQNKGRSAQWYKESSLRIKGLLSKMSILRSHMSNKVRQEFAEMCVKLMVHCSQHLKENFLLLLENLIALSEDENVEMAQLCKNTIMSLQYNTKNSTVFDECAETLFEKHSTRLLEILHRQDELELYAELLFFKGFLRNIDVKKLNTLLSLTASLEHFCLVLLTAVDLEVSREFLNEEYALREIHEAEFMECFKLRWRRFKYLESERCINLMENICALLGQMKQIDCLIFNYLMEALQTKNRMNEILLILTWMFAPRPLENQQRIKKLKVDRRKFADLILEEILNDIYWHLSLHADPTTRLKVDKPSNWFVDHTPGLYESAYEVRVQDMDSDDEDMHELAEKRVNIYDAQQNVLHTCMILDTLGHFASYLGLAFRKHIFRSLHKVLLKVAASNTMVYRAGMFALLSLQNSLGYDNTMKFIENHTDYISYHLNMLIRRTPDSSNAVDILTVVLQLGSQSTLPYLESLFNTLLEECSKTTQEENISAYLRVFNAFLVNVERWKNSTEMEIDENFAQKTEDEINSSEEILTNWLQILNNTAIKLDENMLKEEEEDDCTTAENTNDENEVMSKENNNKKVELPRHIEITKQLLQQILKFMSNANQTYQIQSLECLIVGVPILKDYENELLPLVHLIWHPLTEKFRQKNPLVLNRCFSLLSVLSTHAKDFILKRSLDQVIPNLKIFLKESATKSANEHSNAQTQLYKLQLKLLKEFSNLIITMKIDGKDLNDIAEVIVLYLSFKQPQEFQENAVKFYLDLYSYNGPLIYLVAMKKLHLKEYEKNCNEIMLKLGIVGIKE